MAGFSDIEIDLDTVAAARGGDMAALGRVYEACAPAAYTVLRRLVRREAVAEDLLQEAFADVIQHIAAFEGRSPLPMWIRSIAVRRGLMYLRSPWHRSLEWLDARPDIQPASAGEAARADRCGDLEQALGRLPPLARAVVWLHDVEGYTHGEIAAELGRTVSFSKSQLSRAHARLRQILEQGEFRETEEAPACTPISTP
jgi:RNA polymerase sigma-70 factor (ECF subfamily)